MPLSCAAEKLPEVKISNLSAASSAPAGVPRSLQQVSLQQSRAAYTYCHRRIWPDIPSPAHCAGRNPDRTVSDDFP
eukprot:1428671-Pyramimonas_sp.AAC.1